MANLEGWDLERYRKILCRRGEFLLQDPRITVQCDRSDLANRALMRAFQATQNPENNVPADDALDGEKIAWLFAILGNLVVDEQRRCYGPEHDVRLELQLRQDLSSSTPEQIALFVDDGPAPEEQAMENERKRRLVQEIDKLPPDLAAVARLRLLEGLTLAEIAKKLNLTLGQVTHRWYQAVELLRDVLGPEEP